LTFSQEVRLRIFRSLVVAGKDGLTPGDLGEKLGVAATTLSFHLKVTGVRFQLINSLAPAHQKWLYPQSVTASASAAVHPRKLKVMDCHAALAVTGKVIAGIGVGFQLIFNVYASSAYSACVSSFFICSA